MDKKEMDKKEKDRMAEALEILEAEYPDAYIALHYDDPFQLLVAVILSAQCTDVRVNKVTPALLREIPDAYHMAEAPVEKIEELIRSTGFFRNKAKNIKAAARMIIEKFNGKVPNTMEDMLKLPGVARKTANVVLYNAYGVIEGIAVDTHVKRLSKRLGMTKHDDPVKIEKDLMEIVDREKWGQVTYLLIEHGRNVCKARKPQCGRCVVQKLCPSAKEFLRSG